MKEFSINREVGVKFTPLGEKVLELQKEYSTKNVENGYYWIKTWRLMGLFGKAINDDFGKLFFEPVILIKEEDLK